MSLPRPWNRLRGRVSPRADPPSDFALIGPRFKVAFGALIVIQAAHSMEEYVGRLWESFPPAALVSGLVRTMSLHGACGIPETARAVAFNVTVTQPAASGHLFPT